MARARGGGGGQTPQWVWNFAALLVPTLIAVIGVAGDWGDYGARLKALESTQQEKREDLKGIEERLRELERQRAGDQARLASLTERINAALSAAFSRGTRNRVER